MDSGIWTPAVAFSLDGSELACWLLSTCSQWCDHFFIQQTKDKDPKSQRKVLIIFILFVGKVPKLSIDPVINIGWQIDGIAWRSNRKPKELYETQPLTQERRKGDLSPGVSLRKKSLFTGEKLILLILYSTIK